MQDPYLLNVKQLKIISPQDNAALILQHRAKLLLMGNVEASRAKLEPFKKHS